MKKIFLLVFLQIIILPISILALENKDTIDTISCDLDNNGIRERVSLTKADKAQDKYGKTLLILETSESNNPIDLGDLDFNRTKLKEISIEIDKPTFLGVESIIDNNDLMLRLYILKNGILNEEGNFISDTGIINVKDTNNDNKKEVLVLARDYENNPLKDYIVRIYSYDNNNWQEVSSYSTFSKTYSAEDLAVIEKPKNPPVNADKELAAMKETLDIYYQDLSQTPHSPIKKE